MTEVLTRTVTQFWPGAGPADGPYLLPVPNARSPRLLVPGGHPRAAARAVLRFSAALSVRERAQRTVLAAGLGLGAGRWLPGRIPLSASDHSIEAFLSGVLHTPVRVSLGVGTARANRKPVLEVFDARGRSLAFVKIGDSPAGQILVRREAAALDRLGRHDWDRLEVPRLLHSGDWQGLPVLVMSALPTRIRTRRNGPASLRHPDRPPRAEMTELAEAFAQPELPLSRIPAWRELGTAGPPSDRFTEAWQRVEAGFGAEVLAVGAWHGDWAPWNMAWHGRRLQLWDWEQFGTGVPSGVDAVHFTVQTHLRRDGFTPEALRKSLDRLENPVLQLVWLALIAARYLASARTPEGAPVRSAATIVLNEFFYRSELLTSAA